MKNFTLAIQHEFAPYGITVQLVTPLFVKTKMNNYSSSVMTSGNILVPDVQNYTKSAVFSLGKTSETTGYWTHGIQVSMQNTNYHGKPLEMFLFLLVRSNETCTNLGTNDIWKKDERTIPGRVLPNEWW